MAETVNALADDLEQKFRELCFIHDVPELFLSEYFYELRNQIDIDAEQQLQELNTKYSKKSEETPLAETDKVNGRRSKSIDILKQLEDEMLRQLSDDRTNSTSSDQIYADLRQRIEEFRQSLDNDGATSNKDLDSVYASLADEMFNLSSQLEAKIFGNQTIVYLNVITKPGLLFYAERGHLNKVEMEAYRSFGHERYHLNMKEIHEAIEEARNKPMKAHSRRPLIVTRNMLIVSLMKINEPFHDMILICFGKPPASLEESLGSKLKQVFNDRYQPIGKFGGQDIEAFEENGRIFEGFECKKLGLSSNRLTKLNPQLLVLAKGASVLDINQNLLTHLDEDLLGSCTNLRELDMFKSFSPDTKFSLGFLTPLTQLTRLWITLPEGPADFGLFKHLNLLQHLQIHGVSSIDATKTRTKLTQDSFLQLSNLTALESLDLSYFEIPSLEQDTLAGFRNLRTLSLNSNMISRIHVDAFNNSPSRLQTLELSGNQIADLQPGLFVEQQHLTELELSKNSLRTLTPGCFMGLVGLQQLHLDQNHIEQLPIGVFGGLGKLPDLYLSHNNLKAIKRGVFDELVQLSCLDLGDNPIETIEAGSFRHLASLEHLYLENCHLKSIDDRMFTGLRNLTKLDLDHNQISWFEIVNETETIRLDKANLSPGELEAVRNSMFKDTPSLVDLLLSGNRLEKMDLNVFCNLGHLKHLSLSSNKISELNSASLPNNLASLTHLDLEDNQLTAISKDAFSSAIKLKKLDLSNNKLEALDDYFFEPFDHLIGLNLDNYANFDKWQSKAFEWS